MSGPTVKVQTWGDDLRLPCFVSPAETTGLLTELEPLRRPTIPFQSKHLPSLKRNTWFVLRRASTRAGLLVVWPEQKCCVYVSGEPLTHKRPFTRVALLRLRIDPQFMAEGTGLTVFVATLSSSARRLSVEDTLLWKGRRVIDDEPFRARWALAVQWLEHYCIMDTRLLSGIEIEIASWKALSKLKPDGTWELQPDEAGSQKRYLWIANHTDTVQQAASPTTATAAFVPTIDTGPLVAVATRDSGPEQWMLAAGDGVALGRALIRTLAVSERLRSSKSSVVRVEVEWNPTFSKWEIKGVTDALATANSVNFDAAK